MMRYDICNKWQFNTIQVDFKFLVSPIEIMRSHIIQFKRLQIIVNLAILAFPMCAEKEAINFLSSINHFNCKLFKSHKIKSGHG